MRVMLVLAVIGGCASEPEPSTLLISDYRASAIFRYDGVTGEPQEMFAQIDRPAGMRRGPHDQIFTAGFGRGQVLQHDLHSGQMMGVFYWDTALLEEPVELMFHGDELVVLGNDTNNMVVVGPDGRLARTFGYPDIRQAHDFVIDAAGRVLVATEPAVQVWDLATGKQLGEFGRGQLALAVSITQHRDTIYVGDWELDAIVTFPGGKTFVDGLQDPIAIEIIDDELYVLDSTGVNIYDAVTGDHRRHLVIRDDRLLYPRGFTLIRTSSSP